MSKPILVVTTRLPGAVEARIEREFEARRNPHDRAMTAEELLRAAEGAMALLVVPSNKLDAAFFSKLPGSVRVVASFSVGYEHIDLGAAKARGVAVSNTPGVLTEATADIALLLLLGASRRATEGQALVRSGAWHGLRPTELLGKQMSGGVLGIYGMGRIGQAVARRARAFGMEIHYSNRGRLAPELECGAMFHGTVEGLFAASHFLSLHAPLTAETHHILNERTVETLPWGAVVVNTARGGLVEDEALLRALRAGRVAAAGLDVYEGEPAINPGYLTRENVFLLPHLGSATEETRTAMGMLALDNVEAVLRGEPGPSLLVG